MKLILIAAVSRNGFIGKDNKLPWHLPKDLEHFRNSTRGFPVVMGRKTFDSLGKPLPKRRNIVLTRDPAYKPAGVEVFADWPSAKAALNNEATVYGVGGTEIYRLLLEDADEVVLSEIAVDVDGDAKFPFYEAGIFKNSMFVEKSSLEVQDLIPFKIVTYQKI